jgi:hypothetical protein
LKARIRKAEPKDINFVRDSFLNVVTKATGLTRHHTADGIRKLTDRILTNPRTKVIVAADAEDDDEILGYAVATLGVPDVLHMALTKRSYRRSGVCRALLAELPPVLRVWYPSENLKVLSQMTGIILDPLCLTHL